MTIFATQNFLRTCLFLTVSLFSEWRVCSALATKSSAMIRVRAHPSACKTHEGYKWVPVREWHPTLKLVEWQKIPLLQFRHTYICMYVCVLYSYLFCKAKHFIFPNFTLLIKHFGLHIHPYSSELDCGGLLAIKPPTKPPYPPTPFWADLCEPVPKCRHYKNALAFDTIHVCTYVCMYIYSHIAIPNLRWQLAMISWSQLFAFIAEKAWF